MVNHNTLQQAFDPRRNSLDFLRFVLAALVMVSHTYPLGAFGREPLARFSGDQTTFGSLAVAGFFALSGFLITRSYLSDRSVPRFLWNRCVRIFPGYWVCLILTGLVWVPLLYVTHYGTLSEFWQESGHDAWRYLRINAPLKIRQWGISPVFDDLPYPHALNGSLWSLHYEFQCYLMTAAGGVAGLLRRRRCVLAAFLLLWGMNVGYRLFPAYCSALVERVIDPLTLKLVVWFLAGSVCFLYRDRIRLDGRLCLLAAAVTLLAMRARFLPAVFPVTGAYMLLWCGVRLPLHAFGRRGDFSYGLYIYAFPVQQTLTLFGLHALGATAYSALSLVFTLPLAIASYHFIEKPALRWKLRPSGGSNCLELKPAEGALPSEQPQRMAA